MRIDNSTSPAELVEFVLAKTGQWWSVKDAPVLLESAIDFGKEDTDDLTDDDISNLAAWYSSIKVTVEAPAQ